MNSNRKTYFHIMKKLKPLSLHDTQLLCDQLSLLMSEQVPLLNACAIIRATYPQHGEFLQNNLQAGKSLGETLQVIINLPVYGVFMISVAEQAGALPDSLRELSQLLKERNMIRKNILQAMLYPCMLLIASGALLCLLLFFVLPKIRTVYDSVGASLPAITTFLFYVSDHFWIIFATVAVLLSCASAATIIFRKRYQKQFHTALIFLSKRRFARGLVAGFWTQLFFKTLHTATLSRAPFDRAISMSLESLPRYVIGNLQQGIIERIKQGASFSQVLAEYDREWLFTPYSLALMRLTHYSVPLEKICTIVTTLAQQELQRQLKLFERISEPVILTLVACVIGGVAFAILMPLYSLTQHINVR